MRCSARPVRTGARKPGRRRCRWRGPPTPWATFVPEGVTRWLKAAAAVSRCSGVKAASARRGGPGLSARRRRASGRSPGGACSSRRRARSARAARDELQEGGLDPFAGADGQPRRAAGSQLDLARARVGEHGLDELGLDLDGPGGIRQVGVAAQRPHDRRLARPTRREERAAACWRRAPGCRRGTRRAGRARPRAARRAR